MKIFEANITYQVADSLNQILQNLSSFENANNIMLSSFGIKDFFAENEELETQLAQGCRAANVR